MNDLETRLKNLAFKKAKPFCYHCYEAAPSGRCLRCFSDDLMLCLDGVGIEWGPDWVYKHLLQENLIPANTSAAFDESISQCYPEEVRIGWITVNTATAIKELDPVSWSLAESEWIDFELTEGNLITFDNGSTHYWTHEVEQFLAENESESEAAG